MNKPRRITIQVDEELFQRLKDVPHGFRSPVLSGLIKVALDAIDRDGDIMYGALMSGHYKLVADLEKAA